MDSERIMCAGRGLLMKASPYLAGVFARLEGVPTPGLSRPWTDGTRIHYDPHRPGETPLAAARRCAAELAHCTAHCLLGHVFEPRRDALAADLEAALLLDALLPGWSEASGTDLFRQARHRVGGAALSAVPRVMAEDAFFAEQAGPLGALLAVDDHGRWRGDGPGRRSVAGEGWAALGKRYNRGAGGRRAGLLPGDEARHFRPGKPPLRSYRALLERFAAPSEEPREDVNGFDTILYTYGLSRYGDMPLVEPAETREGRWVEELAIVIDTSGSCIDALTARFLTETRAMLADAALFPRRFNLRVLQCDARVRREDAITCIEDFDRYLDELVIVGGGGTDYRPAFERIDHLVAEGTFRRLPAALFFTDGLGLFPDGPRAYETIFLFYRGHYDDIDVPGWVRRVVLEEE